MMCWSSASVATRTGGAGARSSKAARAMGPMSVYFHASLPRRAVGNPTCSNFAMADCRSACSSAGILDDAGAMAAFHASTYFRSSAMVCCVMPFSVSRD